MRALSIIERTIIEQIAEKMPEPSRSRLLMDLGAASVIDALADGGKVSFAILNYQRPKYQGQHAYGVEGRVDDADGSEISIILYADEEDHLLELELIRWDEGPIQAPNLATLKVY